MKTYEFRVVVKPDEDRWIAYCPALVKQGAATWGYTREEASKNIKEVLQMTLESMALHEEAIPVESQDKGLLVRVTVACGSISRGAG